VKERIGFGAAVSAASNLKDNHVPPHRTGLCAHSRSTCCHRRPPQEAAEILKRLSLREDASGAFKPCSARAGVESLVSGYADGSAETANYEKDPGC
jgi:hypothetical protein